MLRFCRALGLKGWHRVCLYAFFWVPLYSLLVFYTPLYLPIYQKLNEAAELSQFAQWCLTYALFDRMCYFLPSLIGFVTLIFLNEFTMAASRQSQVSRLGWASAFSCAGVLGCFILVKSLTLPVFRHPMPQ